MSDLHAIHHDLANELEDVLGFKPKNTFEAYETIRCKAGRYLRSSFWRVLSDRVLYTKTPHRADRLACFIRENRKRAKANGRPWPPVKIVTKPVFLPAPNQ